MIAAEGEQKASRALKEAADVIQESPSALQVKYTKLGRLILSFYNKRSSLRLMDVLILTSMINDEKLNKNIKVLLCHGLRFTKYYYSFTV